MFSLLCKSNSQRSLAEIRVFFFFLCHFSTKKNVDVQYNAPTETVVMVQTRRKVYSVCPMPSASRRASSRRKKSSSHRKKSSSHRKKSSSHRKKSSSHRKKSSSHRKKSSSHRRKRSSSLFSSSEGRRINQSHIRRRRGTRRPRKTPKYKRCPVGTRKCRYSGACVTKVHQRREKRCARGTRQCANRQCYRPPVVNARHGFF